MLFQFLFFTFFINSSFAQKTLLISDLDDTLRESNSSDLSDALKRLLNGVKPFPMIANILTDKQKIMASEGTSLEVVYLSASYQLIYDAKDWLDKHHFPKGVIFQRNNLKDSKDFKKQVIRKILMANQFLYDEFIFIGDNIHADEEVYLESAAELGLANVHVYIRDVMAKAIPLITSLPSKALPGIHYFFTEYELIQFAKFSDVANLHFENIKSLLDKKQLIADFMITNLKKRLSKEICEIITNDKLIKNCKKQTAKKAQEILYSAIQKKLF
jgi:hypothetical protein